MLRHRKRRPVSDLPEVQHLSPRTRNVLAQYLMVDGLGLAEGEIVDAFQQLSGHDAAQAWSEAEWEKRCSESILDPVSIRNWTSHGRNCPDRLTAALTCDCLRSLLGALPPEKKHLADRLSETLFRCVYEDYVRLVLTYKRGGGGRSVTGRQIRCSPLRVSLCQGGMRGVCVCVCLRPTRTYSARTC
jgi:hypothetical protein